MTIRHIAIGLASFLGATALGGGSVQALTAKECSAKYQAAKTAGTLNGAKWNDFRKTECAADAAAAPAAPAAPPPAAAAKPAAAPKPAAAAPAPAMPSNAMFPSAVSAKYSSESAGKARMHTCLDQYNANKAAGGNGGLNGFKRAAAITASATSA
jgi:hypothetical protein